MAHPAHGAALVTARLDAVGSNRLPEPPRDGVPKCFFRRCHDLLICLLVVAAGVLAVLQVVFIFAPFMHRLFGSVVLELRHWLVLRGRSCVPDKPSSRREKSAAVNQCRG